MKGITDKFDYASVKLWGKISKEIDIFQLWPICAKEYYSTIEENELLRHVNDRQKIPYNSHMKTIYRDSVNMKFKHQHEGSTGIEIRSLVPFKDGGEGKLAKRTFQAEEMVHILIGVGSKQVSELTEFKSCAFHGEILPQKKTTREAVTAPVWGTGVEPPCASKI